jgi:CheY-like chemotaxis protein
MSDVTSGEADAPGGTAASVHDTKGPAGALRGLHVLVVDDNRDTREMLRQLLTHSGALVTTVEGGAAALAVLRSVLADVIVSDLSMPRHDGQWLIRTIRVRGGRHATIPAIAITAYRETEVEADALAAGFDAYLEKPLDFRRLIETIQGVVGRDR